MVIEQARTWAECSESALRGNIRTVRKLLGESKLLGVVKANAYGHGAVRVAEILAEEGALGLAVATLVEAIALRNGGIKLPILILGPTEPFFFDELMRYELTQTVVDYGYAERYSASAVKAGKTLRCHLKLETGMGRLGIAELGEAARALELQALEFEGAFSHFSVSDEPSEAEFTSAQLERFLSAVHMLERQSGVKFKLLHTSNSGGIQNFPESHLDMARPGIVLYGYPASGEISGITPVMELKTRIVQVKRISKGESVSYGRRYIANRDAVIAILPVGYADGLSRGLSGTMSVLIEGEKAPQIGTICMDMCMVDVTELPSVQAGSTATVFGRAAGFTAADMARLRGTIPYEVLCNVSDRVPRIWTP